MGERPTSIEFCRPNSFRVIWAPGKHCEFNTVCMGGIRGAYMGQLEFIDTRKEKKEKCMKKKKREKNVLFFFI